jgi:hypothetical protein
MAKFRLLPTVNVDGYFTAKVKGAIKDVDVGKPVRLSTDVPDTYQLAADGEGMDAFIVGVEAATADGLYLCTLNNMGRVRCEADGALTIGGLVEAAANAAAGTANTNGLPLVSAHAIDTTTAITLAADLLTVNWRVVSGTTTDGDVADEDTYVVIERV